MATKSKTIDFLNRILSNELAAINQYSLHSRMYEHWGFQSLATKEHEEAIEEMRHADNLIKRILFLEGQPQLQAAALNIGNDVKSMLTSDRDLEKHAIVALNEAIAHCAEAQDPITEELLIAILAKEEEHLLWLSTQLSLIDHLSLQNYLQTQV